MMQGRGGRLRPERSCLTSLRVVLVLVALLVSAVGRAAEEHGVLRIDESFVEAKIGRTLDLAHDPTGALGVDAVLAGALPFVPSTRDVPSFGYRGGVEWARFSLDDRRPVDASRLLLEYGYASTDFVDVYAVDGAGKITAFHAGDHVPYAQWPLVGRFPAFRIPRSTATVLVAVRGGASHQVPLELTTADRWHARGIHDTMVQSAFYGALGAMTVYNAIVWLAAGLAIYRWYVLFLASFTLFSLAYGGTLYAGPLGSLPWLNDHLLAFMVACYAITGVRFAATMLDLGHLRARALRFVRGYEIVVGIAGVVSLAIPYSVGMRTVLAVASAGTFFGLTAGIVATRRGERVGPLYLVAWGAFLTGSLVNILRTFGVLPTNAWTEYAQQVGSTIEFLLLSFALADRMKQLQLEATHNAELAATSARAAQEASERALAEQERTNAELRRLDQVKDEFLANTSHELRTPIHGVTGILDALLARPSLSVADREDVTHALASAQRLSSLVTAVLDFSTFRSGGMTIEKRPVDLASIVEDEVRRVASGARVKPTLGLLERSVAAHGDPERLRQLVVQIVGNAVKFTSSGAIDVALRVEGQELVLEVRDTGPGIETSRLESLFAGLEQGDGSTTRDAGGLGIGLALSKRIAEAHGGDLVLRSRVGEGTTVHVRIPGTREAVAPPASVALVATRAVDVRASVVDELQLQRMTSLIPQKPGMARPSLAAPPRAKALARSAALRAPVAPSFGSHAPSGMGSSLASPPSSDSSPSSSEGISALPGDAGVRILVADDDPMNRRVIRLQLAPLGFDLVEAEDGADAIEKALTAGPFDAVLLDVMMPKASGYDVCRKIRETQGPTELPVLMLTAKAQVRDLLEGFEAGANDYVPKPFSKAELLARIRTHVTMARTHQALRRFVPQGALDILGKGNVLEVKLGDTTERSLAVLFSDVRGFSAIAEKRTPAEIFALLNECYARLGPAIRDAGGFVDKYIGDGIMALFPTGAEAALRAAIAMQRALEEEVGGEALRVGVGIHLGPTMLGTLGEPDRFDATVISDTVNVASRIEGASKQLGAKLLVSRGLVESLEDPAAFSTRPLGRIQLKGRAGFVEVVEVLDAEEPLLAEAKVAQREAFAAALASFARGAWTEAREAFGAVVDANFGDEAAMLYLTAATLAEGGDLSAIGEGGSLVLREK